MKIESKYKIFYSWKCIWDVVIEIAAILSGEWWVKRVLSYVLFKFSSIQRLHILLEVPRYRLINGSCKLLWRWPTLKPWKHWIFVTQTADPQEKDQLWENVFLFTYDITILIDWHHSGYLYFIGNCETMQRINPWDTSLQHKLKQAMLRTFYCLLLFLSRDQFCISLGWSRWMTYGTVNVFKVHNSMVESLGNTCTAWWKWYYV